AWSGLYVGFSHSRALIDERRSKARAEERLGRAELARLRHQVAPHFLLNALAAVHSDLPRDPERAGRTLDALCEFLRFAMARLPDEEIAPGEEIEVGKAYLEVSPKRFEGNLSWEVRCPPELHDARIPAYCIQPLVENAVKHGPLGDGRPTRIEVDV